MTNRALLASGSLLLLAAGCTGGGNGPSNQQEPCCAAEGQTVPPAGAFTGGGTARRVQIVRLDPAPALCPDLDAGGLDFGSLIVADGSEVVEVEPDGSYAIEIDEQIGGAPAAGTRLFVRVFDGSGDDAVDRGIGALSTPAVEGATIPVAPIRFPLGGGVGETTLETALDCVFQRAAAVADSANQYQNMTLDDVRAFVDETAVALFNSTATGGTPRIEILRDRAKDYRHGINGMVAVITSSGQPAEVIAQAKEDLRRLRADAEAFVDRCQLGLEPYEGCEGPIGPLRADAYRYWYLSRNYRDYEISWGEDIAPEFGAEVFAAWAEDVLLRLLADSTLNGPYELAAYKQNQLLRLELAHANLLEAYSCYGDANGDDDGDGLCETGTLDPDADAVGMGTGSAVTYVSLNEAVADLRAAIVAASGVNDVGTAWTTFTNQVAFNFGIQANEALYDDNPSGTYATQVVQRGQNEAVAARNDMLDGCNQAPGTDWSNEDIRGRLFYGFNRCSLAAPSPRPEIESAVFASYGTSDPTNYAVVADAVFWATLNAQ